MIIIITITIIIIIIIIIIITITITIIIIIIIIIITIIISSIIVIIITTTTTTDLKRRLHLHLPPLRRQELRHLPLHRLRHLLHVPLHGRNRPVNLDESRQISANIGDYRVNLANLNQILEGAATPAAPPSATPPAHAPADRINRPVKLAVFWEPRMVVSLVKLGAHKDLLRHPPLHRLGASCAKSRSPSSSAYMTERVGGGQLAQRLLGRTTPLFVEQESSYIRHYRFLIRPAPQGSSPSHRALT
jgi:hypothetical protein